MNKAQGEKPQEEKNKNDQTETVEETVEEQAPVENAPAKETKAKAKEEVLHPTKDQVLAILKEVVERRIGEFPVRIGEYFPDSDGNVTYNNTISQGHVAEQMIEQYGSQSQKDRYQGVDFKLEDPLTLTFHGKCPDLKDTATVEWDSEKTIDTNIDNLYSSLRFKTLDDVMKFSEKHNEV